MEKLNYLSKRISAALIDLLLFCLLFKILESWISYKSIDGKNYTHTGVMFLLYYIFYIIQDIFMNKTVGKYVLKLEMKFDDINQIKGYKKYFRIITRRIFDLFELVCPLIYLIFIISTKKNQKLGDLISNIIIEKM